MGAENLDRSEIGTIEINDGSGWQNLGIIRAEIVRINGEDFYHFNISGHPRGIDRAVFSNVDVEIEFVWEEIGNPDLWSLVLHAGGMTTTSAGIQMVVDENITMVGIDWIALAHAIDFVFDSPVIVKNREGSIIYVEGEDYYLDRKGGHLKRVSGGAIEERQMVLTSYSYMTYTGKSFRILGNPEPTEYTVRLTKPLLNGNRLRITHNKVVFSSRTEFPLEPGERGSWAGVRSKIRFMKDHCGVYGEYGLWEIFTP